MWFEENSFKNLKRLVWGPIALVFFIGGLTPAFAASLKELNQKWSEPGMSGAVSVDQLQSVLSLMQNDPETNQLFQEVLGKFGLTEPNEILKILKLCPELSSSERGRFQGGEKQYVYRGLDAPGQESSWSAEVQTTVQKSFASKAYPDGVTQNIAWETQPTICIKPGHSLLDGFLTVVHELTHAKGYQALLGQRGLGEDVLDFKDAEDYALHKIRDPGGEIEAYRAQYRAFKRLKKQVAIPVVYEMEKFFDSQGDLIDSAGLELYILDRMGYRTQLKSDFGYQARNQYQNNKNQLSWYKNKLRPFLNENLKRTIERIEQAKTSGQMGTFVEQLNLRKFYEAYLVRLQAEIQAKEVGLRKMESQFPNILSSD